MKLKRLLCGILAAFLISYSPITSYAAATSIAVTAGSYVINLILNACGIDFSLSSITSFCDAGWQYCKVLLYQWLERCLLVGPVRFLPMAGPLSFRTVAQSMRGFAEGRSCVPKHLMMRILSVSFTKQEIMAKMTSSKFTQNVILHCEILKRRIM